MLGGARHVVVSVILLLCTTAFAESLDELELVASQAISLERMLSQPSFLVSYQSAMERYFGRTDSGCLTFAAAIGDVTEMARAMPWMKRRLWEKLPAAPNLVVPWGKKVAYRFRPVPRRLHALWAYAAPNGCEPEACDPEAATKVRAPATAKLGRWALGMRDSQVFLVEKNGSFTGTAVLLSPYEREGATWALVSPYGARGFTRVSGEEPRWGTIPFGALQKWLELIEKTRPAWVKGYLLAETEAPQGKRLGSLASGGTKAPKERHAEDALTVSLADHVAGLCGTPRKTGDQAKDEKLVPPIAAEASTVGPSLPLAVAPGSTIQEYEIELDSPSGQSKGPFKKGKGLSKGGSDDSSRFAAVPPKGESGEAGSPKGGLDFAIPDLGSGISLGDLGSSLPDDLDVPDLDFGRGVARGPDSISPFESNGPTLSGLRSGGRSGGAGGAPGSSGGSPGAPGVGSPGSPGAGSPSGSGRDGGGRGLDAPRGNDLAQLPPGFTPPSTEPPGGNFQPPGNTPPGGQNPPPSAPPGNNSPPAIPPTNPPPSTVSNVIERMQAVASQIDNLRAADKEIPTSLLRDYYQLASAVHVPELRDDAINRLTGAHFDNASRVAAVGLLQTQPSNEREFRFLRDLTVMIQQRATDCDLNQVQQP